jgi:ABC-type antimicrobial peptide transport system permease subunit
VLGHHASLVAAGLAIGVGAGAAGGTVLRSFLAGVGPTDPVALLAATGFVSGAALTATFLPAWRATRLDPMVTLRDT